MVSRRALLAIKVAREEKERRSAARLGGRAMSDGVGFRASRIRLFNRPARGEYEMRDGGGAGRQYN
jgi:hypothetical protein